ncbi:MAG: hypothetical protein RL653_2045 [Pseudomonadota bacterium]
MTPRHALLLAATLLSAAGCGKGGGGTPDAGPTWYQDVQPLVQARCQSCHVAGGIGPFALTTFEEAKPRAGMMAASVQSRAMPPWMPSDTCSLSGKPAPAYKDSRALTDAEISAFVEWAAAGAPEGDKATQVTVDAAIPSLKDASATLEPSEDFIPPSDAAGDVYRCFPLGTLTELTDVTALEVLPGVAAQVHHAILYAGKASEVAARDAESPGIGWPCYGGPDLPSDGMFVGAWAPGTPPTEYPVGTGVRIGSNGYDTFVMQVHYNLANVGGVGKPDRTKVKVRYAEQLVSRPAYLVPVTKHNFKIPPGAMNYTASSTDDNPLGLPLYVWGVFPHMHQMGKSISVYDEADSQCLVDIPRWDFHWQQGYMFKQPMEVSPTQKVRLRCTWDNPTDREVTWGENTNDEMCLAFLYLTL